MAQILLDSGLLDTSAIMRSCFSIEETAGRNQGAFVRRGQSSGFFIKTEESEQISEEHSLKRESYFLRVCTEFEETRGIVPFLPRLLYTSSAGSLIVLEFLSGARHLDEAFSGSDAGTRMRQVFSDFGRVLGAVHNIFSGLFETGRISTEFPSVLPRAFRIHKPPVQCRRRLTAASHSLIGIVQSDIVLTRRLEMLADSWSPSSLVHGDLRADNVLVVPEADGTERIVLVDWEHASRGDPAWDLAGFQRIVLLWWVSRMPAHQDLTAEQRISKAALPMAVLRDSTRKFWEAYLATQEIPPESAQATDLRNRSVVFTSLWLIQSAIEEAQAAGDRPSSRSILLLQLASNILASPRSAASDLFGHPTRDSPQ